MFNGISGSWFSGLMGSASPPRLPYSCSYECSFEGPESIDFLQEKERGSNLPVRGEVKFTQSKGTAVKVNLGVRMSHPEGEMNVEDVLDIVSSGEGKVAVRVMKPNSILPERYSLYVTATISIPRKACWVPTVKVLAEDFGVTIGGECDLVTKLLQLETVSGNVKLVRADRVNSSRGSRGAPYGVNSTRILVKTASGDIRGNFNLFEEVGLSTNSGAIESFVSPQDFEDPNAAYTASTASGDISSTFTTTGLPARSYKTKVSTNSGEITGNFLLGRDLLLKSCSGGIDASITATDEPKASLSTATTSGDTRIRFTNKLGRGKLGLRANHQAVSGSVDAIYPWDFEGVLEGNVVSGAVAVSGKHVQTVYSGWPITQHAKGVRGVSGYGGGLIQARTMSGGVSLHVGEG